MATDTSPNPTPTNLTQPNCGGCRVCGAPLERTFVDLGTMPLAQNFLAAAQLDQMERFYPLRVMICDECLLVQLKEYVAPADIFTDYAYFSSYSTSWLRHAESYCAMVRDRFALSTASQVVEIASNDGYLLQYLRDAGIPVLGIEPAANVAQAARENGIETLNRFFSPMLARELAAAGQKADLLIGNNVLAHVPDLHALVSAMQLLLADQGVITMEFPHLIRLMEQNQFDTIYHEHYSYFSFFVVHRVFAEHGLEIFDVDELPTHGGSLRIYAHHADDTAHAVEPAVPRLLEEERSAGYTHLSSYTAFPQRVAKTKRTLLAFLIDAKNRGRSVVGYGAPAKGNTLLNYCGVRPDLLEFTVDRSPHKVGTYLPGTHIPVHDVARLDAAKPDYILILPWNLKSEIIQQLAYARSRGAKFVVPIPELSVT